MGHAGHLSSDTYIGRKSGNRHVSASSHCTDAWRFRSRAPVKQRFAAITAIDFAFAKQNQCCLELQV
jgi:hypothetical protein